MTNYSNNPWIPGKTTDVFIPDQLIAGDLKLVTDTVQVGGSGVYERGTVMGMITATGVWIPSIKTANDGSEKPRGVLVDQVDATVTSPQTSSVYVMIEVNFNKLIYDASWGVAGSAAALTALKAGFGATSIFLKTPISAT
ncbi:head decoration protein [Acinetobacter sp. Ac_5812]|uniref:head decoration protein n=1 Tax=Acinetobacter sp. Ac_5812 TaxID=1848937 RepID=UPI001490088A|nr:head decoration protein [Acinetobacter sp. Ac_5812]NNP68955.1 hypothetical protein [Acinetobacter sp. Ac_5812]